MPRTVGKAQNVCGKGCLMRRKERIKAIIAMCGLCTAMAFQTVGCGGKKEEKTETEAKTEMASESDVQETTTDAQETTQASDTADGWHTDDKGTYFLRSGERLTGIADLTSYIQAQSDVVSDYNWLYAFDEEGYLLKEGWTDIEGERYYVNEEGRLYIGTIEVDGVYYAFGSDGKLKSGLRMTMGAGDEDGLYYYEKTGRIKNSWKKVGELTYYFGEDGKALSGWQEIDGKTYYFGVEDTEVNELLRPHVMRTGKHTIEGKDYKFGEDGALKEQ